MMADERERRCQFRCNAILIQQPRMPTCNPRRNHGELTVRVLKQSQVKVDRPRRPCRQLQPEAHPTKLDAGCGMHVKIRNHRTADIRQTPRHSPFFCFFLYIFFYS